MNAPHSIKQLTDHHTLKDLVEELLPQSIQELIDIVGIKAALIIVEERGGIRLPVPVEVNQGHWLYTAIGKEAFTALVEYYAGEEIEIPRCSTAMRAIKDHHIAAAANQGASNAELAREFGYTERGIRKLRRRVEKHQKQAFDKNQHQLF